MWINPGTFLILECWKGHNQLSKKNWEQLKLNHSLYFNYLELEHILITTEFNWGNVKASLPEYNHQGEFGGYIAWFMIRQICNSLNIDPFVNFLNIILGIDWVQWQILYCFRKSSWQIFRINSSGFFRAIRYCCNLSLFIS